MSEPQSPHTPPQPLQNTSLNDMIQLLKEYQKTSLERQDFASADQAKTKIEFLKSQEVVLKREKLVNEDKQNVHAQIIQMDNISKQGEQQIKIFQQHWDQHLQTLIENLKQVQQKLEEQHQKQLAFFVEKLENQQPPKMKYSATVLELRKQLRNLIKTKNYKQAETVKIKLENKDKEEIEKWKQMVIAKKKLKIEILKKKQLTQLNALRIKAQTSFNQSIKQRDHKFEILLKKNRKRRIESSKISRERLKQRTALLNESKSYLTINKN